MLQEQGGEREEDEGKGEDKRKRRPRKKEKDGRNRNGVRREENAIREQRGKGRKKTNRYSKVRRIKGKKE